MTPTGYVINLAASPDRMAHARAELDGHGIRPERVEGLDGRQIDPTTYPGYDDARARAYMGRSMTGGELGCFVGHRRALTALVESGAPLALVFEDDIAFRAEADRVLPALLDWLTTSDLDWHCVNIGARRLKITTPVAEIAGAHLVRAHYFPMLAHAMIWSRAGALAYLEAAEEIFCPADNMMRYVLTRSDKGLALTQALVDAGRFDSDISARSGGDRGAHGRAPGYGLLKQRRLWQEKALAFRHKLFGA